MAALQPARGDSVADLRTSRAKYPTTTPCRNPACSSLVTFDEASRGAPARFCSARCRTEFNRTRRALRSDLAQIQSRLTGQPPQGKLARELKGQLTHLRWLLDSYGGENQGQSAT